MLENLIFYSQEHLKLVDWLDGDSVGGWKEAGRVRETCSGMFWVCTSDPLRRGNVKGRVSSVTEGRKLEERR